MREQAAATTREALADFLRRRREALSPEMVGLPAGQRRRTPGLRRDEVARLAAMSTTYYERLEQGRGPQPSAAILAGLARALRLDVDERSYLYLLAGHAMPRAVPDCGIDSGLLTIMRALDGTCPAVITDDLATIVAQNKLYTAVFGLVAGLPGWEGNLFWRWFGPGRRRVVNSAEQQEAIGRSHVGYLRVIVAQRGYDAASTALVAELRAASAEFKRLWDDHRVSRSWAIVSVLGDRVGRLDLDFALMVSRRSGQRLCTMQAVPGTPTQERLTRLVDIAGREPRPVSVARG
ncbi:helix-turn-helix transcriptional regulator [Kutzneria sp. CA-103260]|uniref:helix-turn-helix transcriptional regulator n=1 Tax=Kutzneria sp. CA-103260 TaxID=2802641 RepID=UPI001BA75B3F|nr:helix-turn-helix transcriptional regulator [Kutzneria sp. CA-103260]QUQ64335.1 XRE family transcriptional regulator [Kutzneria sp. CA-103260]